MLWVGWGGPPGLNADFTDCWLGPAPSEAFRFSVHLGRFNLSAEALISVPITCSFLTVTVCKVCHAVPTEVLPPSLHVEFRFKSSFSILPNEMLHFVRRFQHCSI